MKGNEIDPESNLGRAGEAARKLVALLNDPHPGLISWCQCLHEAMKDVNEKTGVWLAN